LEGWDYDKCTINIEIKEGEKEIGEWEKKSRKKNQK